MDAIDLAGQRALVTGGATGIGAATALALARAGAAVAINYHTHSEAAQALCARIEALGGQAVAAPGDVSDEGDVKRLFEAATQAFGGLDIVVSNAGIERRSPLTRMSLADWAAVLAVNLTGGFLCAREAVRLFCRQGASSRSRALGKIVFISSVHDIIPWARSANYAASKGGLDMLMRSLAQEVAAHRIRVNSVSPGAIKTDINRPAWETEEARQRLLQLIPYGRIGEPEDVARAVVWLASDLADYLTGATLYVDGGMTLYPSFQHGG